MDQRSESNLHGVHADLVAIVRAAHAAMPSAEVSFVVTEGLRTAERQAQLYATGASKTMASRHLTGHAVDLTAWVAAAPSWQMNLYYRIAAAVQDAAITRGIPVVWGGCWESLTSLPTGEDAMADAMAVYSRQARARGQRPFIDGPHFELSRSKYP